MGEIHHPEMIQWQEARFVMHDYSYTSKPTRMFQEPDWPETRRRELELTLFCKTVQGDVAVLPEGLLTLSYGTVHINLWQAFHQISPDWESKQLAVIHTNSLNR